MDQQQLIVGGFPAEDDWNNNCVVHADLYRFPRIILTNKKDNKSICLDVRTVTDVNKMLFDKKIMVLLINSVVIDSMESDQPDQPDQPDQQISTEPSKTSE